MFYQVLKYLCMNYIATHKSKRKRDNFKSAYDKWKLLEKRQF